MPLNHRKLQAIAGLMILFTWYPTVAAFGDSELESLLQTTQIEMKMPGLRAAVRFNDGRIVRASVGLADKETSAPLDNSVGIPGGSTGKTFVAALTMLLVEEGLLSLDDPVSKWLGEAPWYHRLPNHDQIRVRHLLSHSGGIKDYIDTAKFHFSMIGRVVRDGSAYYEPEELIEFVLDKKPLFAAGMGYHYTDAGYLVLGRLIEAATGEQYYDLLEERILIPHKLTGIRPADKSVLTDIATGYMGGGRNLKEDGRMKFDPRSEWTGGGLITTPTMLVKFYGALVNDEIVNAESRVQMINGGWHNPRTPGSHYGYGLFVDDDGQKFGHDGLWPGYLTHVTHFVAGGFTVAVQTNRDGRLDMQALADKIATRVQSP